MHQRAVARDKFPESFGCLALAFAIDCMAIYLTVCRTLSLSWRAYGSYLALLVIGGAGNDFSRHSDQGRPAMRRNAGATSAASRCEWVLPNVRGWTFMVTCALDFAPRMQVQQRIAWYSSGDIMRLLLFYTCAEEVYHECVLRLILLARCCVDGEKVNYAPRRANLLIAQQAT